MKTQPLTTQKSLPSDIKSLVLLLHRKVDIKDRMKSRFDGKGGAMDTGLVFVALPNNPKHPLAISPSITYHPGTHKKKLSRCFTTSTSDQHQLNKQRWDIGIHTLLIKNRTIN